MPVASQWRAAWIDFEIGEHWQVIDNCFYFAARMLVNSVLTPTWTPPLDIAIGGTRTATQLIAIRDVGEGKYEFDFTLLQRWLDLCKSHGIKGIEVAHFFTQWDASGTPAIYVDSDGETEQRFG